MGGVLWLVVDVKNLLKKIPQGRKMPPSLSVTNILQALYEESTTIKTYVDCIASGQPAPFTLITKTSDHDKNERIVDRAKLKKAELEKQIKLCREDSVEDMLDVINEILDEAMVLDEEKYEVYMEHDRKIVIGTIQTVDGGRVEGLKEFAKFKGYEIVVNKV